MGDRNVTIKVMARRIAGLLLWIPLLRRSDACMAVIPAKAGAESHKCPWTGVANFGEMPDKRGPAAAQRPLSGMTVRHDARSTEDHPSEAMSAVAW